MSWFFPGASFFSKLLCTFLIVLIVLQYMFGTVGHLNRRWDTFFYASVNSTRVPVFYNTDHGASKHRSPFLDLLINNSLSPIYSTTSLYLEPNSTLTYLSNNTTSENATSTPLCPPVPPNLEGRIKITKTPIPTILELERKFPWLQAGGRFAPSNCQPRYKVAIIVPYRARAEHLLIFLEHMHQFLKKQQIDYTIFIIEQDGAEPFNRAMLMNVGYKEALKIRDFDCFIFHDVDLLPEDDRNLYTCPEQPRHMSVAVDVFKYKLPYSGIFGGVSALTKDQFNNVNGFSNSFWGWGGEDDDMSNRLRFHNYYISRYPINIARYTMLTHQKEKANPRRYENLQQGKKKFKTDGLINLKYNIIETKSNLLYTWFLVDLRKPS